jgi:tetratricopeptide (TPR) repeat protein
VWIGQNRKVYLVNGTDKPYTVAVAGRQLTLAPSAATQVRLPEGEVKVEFADPAVAAEPVSGRIETGFFGRPFAYRTFVINPDRLALVVREEGHYGNAPRPPQPQPPELHVGEAFYSFQGLDYEFAPFPRSIKSDRAATKTRVALAPLATPLERLLWVSNTLDEKGQLDYARRWLQFDPNNFYFLTWLLHSLKDDEALAFVQTGLAVRPVRVEWHRVYQRYMEKAGRAAELVPTYRQLVAETNNSPDTLYLLGRLLDLDEGEQLLRRAATAQPPSAFACHALGQRALASGRFAEAVDWMEQANRLAGNNLLVQAGHWQALLAAGRYDRLFAVTLVQNLSPFESYPMLAMRIRAQVAKGDPGAARAMIDDAVGRLQGPVDAGERPFQRAQLQAVLCCAQGDVPGYLKAVEELPNLPQFERPFLHGKLADAAAAVERQSEEQAAAEHGLVYLAALKAGDKKLADEQWQQLLAATAKGDRFLRQLGDVLAGRKPVDVEALRRLPLEPRWKPALLAVVARRYPDRAKDLLPLIRTLDFERDATSLCLRQVLK